MLRPENGRDGIGGVGCLSETEKLKNAVLIGGTARRIRTSSRKYRLVPEGARQFKLVVQSLLIQ